MKCPVHDEDLRDEISTGFCQKCLKHYPRCPASYGCSGCDLVAGHPKDIPHRDARGHYMWTDPEFVGQYAKLLNNDLARLKELLLPIACKKAHESHLDGGVVHLRHPDGHVCTSMPHDVYEDLLKWKEEK